MTTYNKLVRDNIPLIIADSGKHPLINVAEEEEFYQLLKDKLQEEVGEFLATDKAEELADILEVLQALAKCQGLHWEQILELADVKRNERGGFEQRIILVEVPE